MPTTPKTAKKSRNVMKGPKAAPAAAPALAPKVLRAKVVGGSSRGQNPPPDGN